MWLLSHGHPRVFPSISHLIGLFYKTGPWTALIGYVYDCVCVSWQKEGGIRAAMLRIPFLCKRDQLVKDRPDRCWPLLAKPTARSQTLRTDQDASTEGNKWDTMYTPSTKELANVNKHHFYYCSNFKYLLLSNSWITSVCHSSCAVSATGKNATSKLCREVCCYFSKWSDLWFWLGNNKTDLKELFTF